MLYYNNIYVFTNHKNNRFQKKLIGQNTNIWISAPPIIELATALHMSKFRPVTVETNSSTRGLSPTIKPMRLGCRCNVLKTSIHKPWIAFCSSRVSCKNKNKNSLAIDVMQKSWSGPCILGNGNLRIVIGHSPWRVTNNNAWIPVS